MRAQYHIPRTVSVARGKIAPYQLASDMVLPASAAIAEGTYLLQDSGSAKPGTGQRRF